MPVKTRPEQVMAEVQRFWNAMSHKSGEELASFYSPNATVFGSSALSAEPGRVAAIRRRREYLNPEARVAADLGRIEVHFLGDSGAVASYTFSFNAQNVSSDIGDPKSESIRHGRATQVFEIDPDGKMRILHEHISIARAD
jgi:ketosteroid isomerase-like protein